MGATNFEVGQILRYLGADDGLNMDGGGSTTLLVRKNGRIRKLNRHAKGAERKVGGMLGICTD
jgi:exopolysaccharide biosynthesis protein